MRNADRDYLSLLYDIGELSGLIRESTDIQNLIDRTVAMISERLQAEVCSIYLYDEETRELVLKATKGLNPEAVEKVRMAYGTGLVGTTLEGLDPIVEGDAPHDPRFKYFSEAHEDAFRSFLSVPLRKGEVQIGVLVVQHSSPDYFNETDARALRAVASQLAGVLQNVRLLMDLRRRDGALERPAGEDLSFVEGQAASPGFAYGPAVVFDRSHVRLLETGDVFNGTEEDFHQAVAATARQLDQLQEKITERLPESASLIFSSHLLMLKDAQFADRIVAQIRAGIVASEAVREAARHYIHLFGTSPHLYLQEKAKDIEDLAGRLLRNLAGHSWEDPDLYERKVVIAPTLYPSEVLKFAAEGAAGIVLTSGGVRVCLMANINLLSEVSIARELKAEGIGLYRTEFPFLIRANFPAEEEEYRIYKRLCDAMPGRRVIFRTLDIGGDKVPAYWEIAGEPNPQLGLRSIRFSLRHPEQFRQQVRAILRAGTDTPHLGIMFPMISSLDEFARARELVMESLQVLRREGLPHHTAPALGAMIEVPAVVEIAEELAREADFLSIGTNDFVQYLLGVDRMNEQVAYAYRPEHPSVLRSLKRLTDAAGRAGKEISVCGEMAHDPDLLPFLLGIGIRTLSADPQHLTELQQRIGAITLRDAEAYTAALLAESSLAGVQKVIGSGMNPGPQTRPAK